MRTFQPPLSAAFGKKVTRVERLGKRIVLELEGELFLVIHLMIAGRLRWRLRGWGPRQGGARGVRFPRAGRYCSPKQAPASVPPSRARGARSARPIRLRRARGGIGHARRVWRAAHLREPHRQTFAHRSPALQRHRQLLFRRDPARRSSLAGQAHSAAERARDCPPLRSDHRTVAHWTTACAKKRATTSPKR